MCTSRRPIYAKSIVLGDGLDKPWKDGYVDLMHTETSMAASREKRFYRVSGGRGYTLSFVARDDVFHLVSSWFDTIAGSLKTGSEVTE